jgi:hypothetical protein
MASKTSLYKGFVKGRSNSITLGPNNPKIDTSSAGADAQAILHVHSTKGVRSHPKVDGPARKVSGLPGRRVNGATRIRGGQM